MSHYSVNTTSILLDEPFGLRDLKRRKFSNVYKIKVEECLAELVNPEIYLIRQRVFNSEDFGSKLTRALQVFIFGNISPTISSLCILLLSSISNDT